MERNVLIPWDLEGTSLQIKTNSTLGSGDAIMMTMYDKDNIYINDVNVSFSAALQFQIGWCNYYKDFPVQPPVKVEKIWTIAKTETAIIIVCNNVEVLNFVFTDGVLDECVTKWSRDIVEHFKFNSNDKASDFYRAGIPLY